MCLIFPFTKGMFGFKLRWYKKYDLLSEIHALDIKDDVVLNSAWPDLTRCFVCSSGETADETVEIVKPNEAIEQPVEIVKPETSEQPIETADTPASADVSFFH